METKLLHHYFNKSVNDNDVAIIYDAGTGPMETLTYEELEEYSNLISHCLEPVSQTTHFVGVVCSPGVNLPAILLGILRAGLAYYCFDHRFGISESKSVIKHLAIDILLAESDWLNQFEDSERDNLFQIQRIFMKTSTVSVVRTYRAQFGPENISPGNNSWAYASVTSGTTGKRKIVLVPHASISPNIKDFINLEKITSEDTIFGASPATFDPFNVDLFIALGSHSKILFVADSIKLNPKELCNSLLSHHVTILHCTPSLLLRFGEVETASLFQNNSSLRVVALGGERCVDKDHLKKLIPVKKWSRLTLLNVYGITELSCWASVEKINLEHDSPISVGEPLSETDVRLFENDYRNQIYIGSRTRFCRILNELDGSEQFPTIVNGITYRETGDAGELLENGAIIFNGRLDRMIKRHGHFVNLGDIENRVLLTNLLSLSATFYFFGKIYLIVKFTKDQVPGFDLEKSKLHLGKCLEKYLPIHYYPDKIIVISDDVPVTCNGKLDVKYIEDIVKKKIENISSRDLSNKLHISYPPEDVDEFILTTWKNNTRNRNDFHSADTFFQAGGNSARAVRFVEEIMQGLLKFGTRIHADEEISFLNTLNRCSFDVVRKYIFKSICENKPHIVEVSPFNVLEKSELEKQTISNNGWVEPAFKRLPITAITTTEDKMDDITEKLLLEIPIAIKEWTIDLLGCVDATPTIFTNKDFRCKGTIVLVGSHSGYVAAVNLEVLREINVSDGDSCVLWRRKFPDRIATMAGIHPSRLFAFIVCCDEILYTICVETGAIRWLFHINGLTRSTPICSEDGKVVYVLSAFPNGQLTAINFEDGVKMWSTILPFVTAPLSVAVIGSAIFVTTADVPIIKLSFEGEYMACRGDVEKTCTPPIPVYLPGRTLLLLATLKGFVFAFDEDLNKEVWRFKGPEHDPVNPPCLHQCANHSRRITYVTHGGIFRVLDANTGALIRSRKLKIEFRSSPACSTLKFLMNGNTEPKSICVVILTDVVGGVHILNMDTCKSVGVIHPLQAMECFSSAVICGDLIAYGGRSNKLHILQMISAKIPSGTQM